MFVIWKNNPGRNETHFRKTKLLHQVFQPFPPTLRLIQHSYQSSDNILYFIHCLYPIGFSSWVVQKQNDLFMSFDSDRAKQPFSWICHMGWDCNCQLWAQWLAILKAADPAHLEDTRMEKRGTNIGCLPTHSCLPSQLLVTSPPPPPQFLVRPRFRSVWGWGSGVELSRHRVAHLKWCQTSPAFLLGNEFEKQVVSCAFNTMQRVRIQPSLSCFPVTFWINTISCCRSDVWVFVGVLFFVFTIWWSFLTADLTQRS